MCRFAAYFGLKEILLDELLVNPKNSLIKQSHEAREGAHGINADGFGVAWYNFEISCYPGIFKSTQPAWNDNNLTHISQKIKSSCFMAHVRASTVGDVNQNNCHPFAFKEYSMVHNGTIRNFDKYKKEMVNKIDEELFLQIRGNTDSECLFFLIITYVRSGNSLEDSVKKAIAWVTEIQKNCDGFSRINIVITDGKDLIATRYVSKGETSLSLNYCIKSNASDKKISSIILSSEALNDNDEVWFEVPENHYICLNRDDMKFKVEEI